MENNTLYLVGTPIGNLEDMTYRAVKTLRDVDVIFCEDTRHTLILLNNFNIKKPLKSYYQHKEKQGAEEIYQYLQDGKTVALVSDAGMPSISDPGAVVVRELRERGCNITVVPSPTAVTSAVALCGLKHNGFSFIGFLPEKNKDKDTLIKNTTNSELPLVFYSAPHDIEKDLNYLFSKLGDRECFVVKEITKMFETVYRGTLGNIQIADKRGEFVIVIEGQEIENVNAELSVKEYFLKLRNEGIDKKEAIKLIAKERGQSKNEIYMEVIDLG